MFALGGGAHCVLGLPFREVCGSACVAGASHTRWNRSHRCEQSRRPLDTPRGLGHHKLVGDGVVLGAYVCLPLLPFWLSPFLSKPSRLGVGREPTHAAGSRCWPMRRTRPKLKKMVWRRSRRGWRRGGESCSGSRRQWMRGEVQANAGTSMMSAPGKPHMKQGNYKSVLFLPEGASMEPPNVRLAGMASMC